MGLKGGETLEVSERDGKLEIEVAAAPVKLKKGKGREGPVVETEEDIPPLTDELVRDTIRRIRS